MEAGRLLPLLQKYLVFEILKSLLLLIAAAVAVGRLQLVHFNFKLCLWNLVLSLLYFDYFLLKF